VTATPGVARYLSTGLPGEVVVRDELKIPGRLETNENRTARIGAPTTGRLTAIHAVVGQRVRQGDVLAEISSPELSSAQLGFLKAHSAEQLAQRGVDRARLLLEADVIGAAELQRRENELSVARAEKQAARDQLRVLGLPLRAIDRLMQTGQIITAAPITATKTGTVIERRAALGQVVAPSDELFTVTNLGALWAVADVPEQDARQARVGQRVELQVPALGEQRTEGTISWVSDLVDPQTRTIRVRMELPNPEGELKPAMLATMLIKGPERRRLVVPKAALVRDENRDFLFVAESADRYRMRAVTLGAETGDARVVLEGLRAEERIVTSGAFHLNNERRQLAVGGR
jgi:cobalt-zinc-cadmium efflux system membrane fusion protein